MRLARILRATFRRPGSAPVAADADVHEAARFRALLERERARADRIGGSVALIALTPRLAESRAETILFLARFLGQRLRCTDDVGWLDDERLGVLLPGTTADGAWKVADDTCGACPDHLPPPVCEIYAYPLSGNLGPLAQPRRPDVADPQALSLDLLFLRPSSVAKRLFDIVASACGLLLLAPLLLLLALIVKVTSPGPVFFLQRRTGWGGRIFTIYKFRTMTVDAELSKAALRQYSEQDGPAFKMKNDPRVTLTGRILRATSLDELPQLWNIFTGEMSLVGPRPLPCPEADACAPWQKQRLLTKPGLTCIWQVYGRSRVAFDDWIRMDLRYLRTQSFVRDLLLVVLTVPAVVARRGAH